MANKKDTVDYMLQRHHWWLQRLVPSLSRSVISEIDKNNPELRGEIIDFLEKNPTYSKTIKAQNQLDVLRGKVAKIRGGAISEASTMYQADMLELATKEQLYISGALQDLGSKTFSLSSASAIAKMVERQAFVGQTISQMYKSLSVNDTERVIKTVREGLSQGLTRPQIEKAIFGTKGLNYTDGVLQTTRNNVNNFRNGVNSGIVRTTTNAITSESRSMLYQANSDIVNKEQFTAVLDGRTTFFCAGHHGMVYRLGEGPQLPVHYNERSIYTPIVDGLNIDSTQPVTYDTRTRKQREKDFRKESRETGESIGDIRRKWSNKAIGQVSDKATFDDVLNSNDKFAKSYLGNNKYKLWKDGGLKLTDLTDSFAQPLTMQEIYKGNSTAFKNAGIAKPK